MIDKIVAHYILMRDRKAQLKADFDASTAELDAGMVRCEAHILKHFQETGQLSASTEAGTAYLSNTTSATVADWESLLNWVKANDNWNFLDRKVNKTAVVEFRSANDDLPPGVNWREEKVVRIRRAS